MIFGTRSLGRRRARAQAETQCTIPPSSLLYPFLPPSPFWSFGAAVSASQSNREGGAEKGSEEEASKGSRNWRRGEEGKETLVTNPAVRPTLLSLRLFPSVIDMSEIPRVILRSYSAGSLAEAGPKII